MPQKFLHLNCFFTCGMIASSLVTFWSMVFAVGGCTRAPRTSASLVRVSQSLIRFASPQSFDFTIVLYWEKSGVTEDAPYQKLAFTRICWRGPSVSAGERGGTSCSAWSSHGYARSYAWVCAIFWPPWRRITAALTRRFESGDASAFVRSEEHTSELQSPCNLVCRL